MSTKVLLDSCEKEEILSQQSSVQMVIKTH